MAAIIYYAFVFVECIMEWCHVGPGRTDGAFVLRCICLNLKLSCVLNTIQGRNLTLPCVLSKYTTLATTGDCTFMFVKCMSGVIMLVLDKQTVRSYWCACIWRFIVHSRCSRLWDRNRTLMCCPNTLKWRWRLYAFVFFVECMERPHVGPGRTDGAFVLRCICLNLKLSCVLNTIQGRNLTLPCVLSKYTTLATTGAAAVRLCSLNVCHGVILSLHKQTVR